MTTRLKGTVGNLALLVGSVVVLFMVLELAVRTYERLAMPDESWAEYDSDLGYRPRPHYADFNELGMRDHPIRPDTSLFRILFLGDSVPFYGDSIGDTYVGWLEARLNERPGPSRVDVLNAGVRGYTNYQEIVYLKKFGLPLHPDVVGVGFVLNDLHRILHRFEMRDGKIVGDYVVTDSVASLTGNQLFQIIRPSRFLMRVRRRVRVLDAAFGLRASSGYTFEFRGDLSPAWKADSWIAIQNQLAQFARLSREHGFRPFLVAFPIAEQYRADYLARDSAYVLFPQRRLREICNGLNIPYLDLYPLLDAVDFEDDGLHLTRRGREKAARATAGFLEAQGLVSTQRLEDVPSRRPPLARAKLPVTPP
ncbi:MAG TPA: GDSL-type esterase/lipase family protein [Rhodothermales bacterium]